MLTASANFPRIDKFDFFAHTLSLLTIFLKRHLLACPGCDARPVTVGCVPLRTKSKIPRYSSGDATFARYIQVIRWETINGWPTTKLNLKCRILGNALIEGFWVVGRQFGHHPEEYPDFVCGLFPQSSCQAALVTLGAWQRWFADEPGCRYYYAMKIQTRTLVLFAAAILGVLPAAPDRQRLSPHENGQYGGGRKPRDRRLRAALHEAPRDSKVRKIWGGLVPYGKIWRTGADEATLLITQRPIELGGIVVPAGAYTLWTLPTADGKAM